MIKGNLPDVIWSILVVTAFTEALCGRKAMKRIVKRIKALNGQSAEEVWLRVYNNIYIHKRVHTGEVEYENLPIVKEESRRIFKLIKSKEPIDYGAIRPRMVKIICYKMRKMEKDSGLDLSSC
jgi:hypothetical protein